MVVPCDFKIACSSVGLRGAFWDVRCEVFETPLTSGCMLLKRCRSILNFWWPVVLDLWTQMDTAVFQIRDLNDWCWCNSFWSDS